MLKKVLIGLLVIIALVIGGAYLVPGDVQVERSATFKDAKVETVFKMVNNLKNWEKWSPWAQRAIKEDGNIESMNL